MEDYISFCLLAESDLVSYDGLLKKIEAVRRNNTWELTTLTMAMNS